jgi:hypothetical protein
MLSALEDLRTIQMRLDMAAPCSASAYSRSKRDALEPSCAPPIHLASPPLPQRPPSRSLDIAVTWQAPLVKP